MSLDRMQSKDGLLSVGVLPTVAGFPGGVDFGGVAGFAAATAADGGGALYMRPMPRNATVQTLTTGATIVHNGAGVVFLTQASAVTGILLQAGVVPGQHLFLVNTSGANTLQFAAAASSLVLGTLTVAVLRAVLLVWNANLNRWVNVGV